MHVRAPAEHEREHGPAAKLDLVARKAVQAVRDEGEPLSKRRLCDLMDVRASDATKRSGIEHAEAHGELVARDGPRRAILYTLPEWSS